MKVIDYSNTIMYKLVPNNLNLDLIYIGHTTNFRQRKALHKSRCNNINDKCYNSKVYSMIRENGDWSEWSMIEIEKYPCLDSNEACKRERELIEQYNANLNTKKAYLTPEEILNYSFNYNPIYRASHKNETREYNAKYKAAHKNEIRIQQKKYVAANKDKINAKRRERRQQQKLASLNLQN
jgi:hypothetical protein